MASDPCDHRRRMFVPVEGEGDLMADVCLKCDAVLEIYDDDLEEEGGSLGDPEGDEWDELYLEG